MLYNKDKECILFRDINGKKYTPWSLYKGGKKIAGYKNTPFIGESLAINDTYDYSAKLKINGRSEQTQTTQGKNLFDQSKHNLIRQFNSAIVNVPNYLVSGTYRFSCDIVSMQDIAYSSSGALLMLRLTYADNTTGYLQIAADTSSVGKINAGFSTSQPIKYIAFYSASRWTGGTITVNNCQLEQGLTATAYEPFVPNSPSPDYPSPINSVEDFDVISVTPNIVVNGNFADGQNNWVLTSISYFNIINKTLNYESVQQGFIAQNINFIQGNTYLALFDLVSWSSGNLGFSSSGGLPGTQLTTSIGRKSYKAVANGVSTYLKLYCGTNNFGGKMSIKNIMVIDLTKLDLADKTVSELENMFPNWIDKRENTINFPYTLRSLPDGTKDYIEIDNINKTAKLVRNIGERVFTGSEAIGSLIDFTNTVRFEMAILAGGLHGLTNKISTHFPTIGTSADETEHIRGTAKVGVDQLIIFWINKTRLTGYSSELTDTEKRNLFKSWLTSQYIAGTPVKVQYQLATPIITDLDYNEVLTYYPYTNIYTNATIQPTLEGKIRIIDKN